VTIGLSLPLGYLTGAAETANGKCLSEAFGKPCDCLAELKDHGVGSVELKRFGPGSSADSVLGVAQNIVGSGMRLTLHGYLSGDTAGHLSEDVYPELLPTLGYLRDQQGETMMVVHALVDPDTSCDAMTKSTVRALERLAESIRQRSFPVRVSLEINRYHGVEAPGTTYDSLLGIARRLGDPDIGFCWDMGHTRSSVLQNRLPAVPPPEFLRKVIHTHLHGLSPDGDTHWPLTESSSHIASGVGQLRPFGYAGTYNLELYPMRWGSEHAVREGILGSVLCLREILDKAQEAAGTDSDRG